MQSRREEHKLLLLRLGGTRGLVHRWAARFVLPRAHARFLLLQGVLVAEAARILTRLVRGAVDGATEGEAHRVVLSRLVI